jgi:broad specificity phosphatase PhoE
MSTSPLPVLLVRHGEAYGNLRQPISAKDSAEIKRIIDRGGDDELTDVGRAQAVALARDPDFVALVSECDVVLVSPLLRALETCLIALSTDALQMAREKMGRRSALKIFVHPDLREINSFSKLGDELYWRHRGHRLSHLKDFVSSRLPPFADLIWHPSMAEDRVWWDAEGVGLNPHRCTVNYSPSAFLRAHSFSQTLRNLADEYGWSKICCVAHENVYRCLTGVLSVQHPPHMLKCILPMRNNVHALSRHIPSVLERPLQKIVPVELVRRASLKPDVLIVLGCGDPNERCFAFRSSLFAGSCNF